MPDVRRREIKWGEILAGCWNELKEKMTATPKACILGHYGSSWGRSGVGWLTGEFWQRPIPSWDSSAAASHLPLKSGDHFVVCCRQYQGQSEWEFETS